MAQSTNQPSPFIACLMPLIAPLSVLWLGGLIVMPLYMLQAVIDVGVTTVKCDRLEPSLVNCETQRSILLGFVQDPLQKHKAVLSAEYRSRTGLSNGQPTSEHWVTVITRQGEVTLLEDRAILNGVQGDAAQMEGLATQLNQFLESQQSQLTLQSKNRFKSSNLALIARIGPFFLLSLLIPVWVLRKRAARIKVDASSN